MTLTCTLSPWARAMRVAGIVAIWAIGFGQIRSTARGQEPVDLPFTGISRRLEQLHQKASRARLKRDFATMEDARIDRQQLLRDAAQSPPFERPPELHKRPVAEREAFEEEEASYTRLVPWIEGYRAVVGSEKRTRKMQYAEAAKLLRDHWRRTYSQASEMPAEEPIFGDVGAALFRTCQAAAYVYPDFLSGEGHSGRRMRDDDAPATAGLDEAELKAILRTCRRQDPCQVEVNLMLAFLERLTNDNAFLRAENRPELETRNKLLLDLAEGTDSSHVDAAWQPPLEFLKAQSTAFILDELSFYDAFLKPRQLCAGTDHARRPLLVTETNDPCLQTPTATTLKPMVGVLNAGQWTSYSLYFVRLRKAAPGGPADTLWPLVDKRWPSSPSALQLIDSLEAVFDDYLLSQLSTRFPPAFFAAIGRDFVASDRIQQGVNHFREQTRVGQVPTALELEETMRALPAGTPRPTRLSIYAGRMAAFVTALADAFRKNYVREHPEMNNQVEALLAQLSAQADELQTLGTKPTELSATLRGLSIDYGQVTDGSGLLARNVLRLQRHYQDISEAIAGIASDRGITDIRRKEMASRVESLAAKTRQLAILQTTDYAATAMEAAASRAAQGTTTLRTRVNELLQTKNTPPESGVARPLVESELAFLRDFRRLVTPVDELLLDIQRDCAAIHRKLSPSDGDARITLPAVEQTAQLLSSIVHNLSQLAPSGLFDAVTYAGGPDAPPDNSSATWTRPFVTEPWSATAVPWRTGCFRDADELAAAINVIDALRVDLQTWIDADRARRQVERYCDTFQGKRHSVETPLYTAEVVPIVFPYQFGELQDAFRYLPRLHLTQAAELRRLLGGKTPLGGEAVDFDRTYLSRLQASNISSALVRAFDASAQQWVVTTVTTPNEIDVSFLLCTPSSTRDQRSFNGYIADLADGSFTLETWLGDRPTRLVEGACVVDFDGLEGLIPCSDAAGDRSCRNRHWQSIRRIAPDALQRDATMGIPGGARFFELVTRDRGATVTDRAVVYGRADWQQLDANATNDFLPGMQSLAPSLPGAELLRHANARPVPPGGFLWLPVCPPYAVGGP